MKKEKNVSTTTTAMEHSSGRKKHAAQSVPAGHATHSPRHLHPRRVGGATKTAPGRPQKPPAGWRRGSCRNARAQKPSRTRPIFSPTPHQPLGVSVGSDRDRHLGPLPPTGRDAPPPGGKRHKSSQCIREASPIISTRDPWKPTRRACAPLRSAAMKAASVLGRLGSRAHKPRGCAEAEGNTRPTKSLPAAVRTGIGLANRRVGRRRHHRRVVTLDVRRRKGIHAAGVLATAAAAANGDSRGSLGGGTKQQTPPQAAPHRCTRTQPASVNASSWSSPPAASANPASERRPHPRGCGGARQHRDGARSTRRPTESARIHIKLSFTGPAAHIHDHTTAAAHRTARGRWGEARKSVVFGGKNEGGEWGRGGGRGGESVRAAQDGNVGGGGGGGERTMRRRGGKTRRQRVAEPPPTTTPARATRARGKRPSCRTSRWHSAPPGPSQSLCLFRERTSHPRSATISRARGRAGVGRPCRQRSMDSWALPASCVIVERTIISCAPREACSGRKIPACVAPCNAGHRALSRAPWGCPSHFFFVHGRIAFLVVGSVLATLPPLSPPPASAASLSQGARADDGGAAAAGGPWRASPSPPPLPHKCA